MYVCECLYVCIMHLVVSLFLAYLTDDFLNKSEYNVSISTIENGIDYSVQLPPENLLFYDSFTF